MLTGVFAALLILGGAGWLLIDAGSTPPGVPNEADTADLNRMRNRQPLHSFPRDGKEWPGWRADPDPSHKWDTDDEGAYCCRRFNQFEKFATLSIKDHKLQKAFACEVKGRATGEGSKWGLMIGEDTGDRWRGILVFLSPGDSKVGVDPPFRWLGNNFPARIGTFKPPAVKRSDDADTLTVIFRDDEFKVYVNDRAVLDALDFPEAKNPSHFALMAFGPNPNKDAWVGFSRFRLWEIDD